MLLDGGGLSGGLLVPGISVRDRASLWIGRIFDLSLAGFYNGLLPCRVHCSLGFHVQLPWSPFSLLETTCGLSHHR